MERALEQIRLVIIGLAISNLTYWLWLGGDLGFKVGGLFGALMCYVFVRLARPTEERKER